MESVREHMRECPSESEIAQVVLQELEQRGNCTMEELIHNLPEYSWNQVFTAVDRLSREGAPMVKYSSRVDRLPPSRNRRMSVSAGGNA